jgi:hypothetical protein
MLSRPSGERGLQAADRAEEVEAANYAGMCYLRYFKLRTHAKLSTN